MKFLFAVFKVIFSIFCAYQALELFSELSRPAIAKTSEELRSIALKNRTYLLGHLDGRIYMWIVDKFFPNSRLGKVRLGLV